MCGCGLAGQGVPVLHFVVQGLAAAGSGRDRLRVIHTQLTRVVRQLGVRLRHRARRWARRRHRCNVAQVGE